MALSRSATGFIVGAICAAVGLGAGMGIQSERDAVEPWDDGLLKVECPRDGKPNLEVTARGFGVMDDGDAKHPEPPYILINLPFDPKLGKSPDDITFHADGKNWPVGCLVSGVKQKEIVRRGP